MNKWYENQEWNEEIEKNFCKQIIKSLKPFQHLDRFKIIKEGKNIFEKEGPDASLKFMAKNGSNVIYTCAERIVKQSDILYDNKDYVSSIRVRKLYFDLIPKPWNLGALNYFFIANVYSQKLNDIKNALEYYRKAAEYEIEFPNDFSNQCLNYAYFVIKNSFKNDFLIAEQILLKNYENIVPQKDKYKLNTMLAIFAKVRKDKQKTAYYKTIAEEIIKMKDTTSAPGRAELGQFDERDPILEKLLNC